MKTKAVRLYGKNDLRLEEFELPEINDDEILMSVVTDSICMSTWKLAKQGEDHKKTPENIKEKPIIIGHEFCGEVIKIGKNWENKYKESERYVVQANLQLPDAPWCPGYSYQYCGGDATYIILPADVMKQDCLLPYNGETYFEGSLIEPLSCIIGAFKGNYHLIEGTYDHKMGIKEGGNLLISGGTGPMGLLAIDYALHGDIKPKNIVITDVNEERLKRASELYKTEGAVKVHYVNTAKIDDVVAYLKETAGGGYDDVFIFAPVPELVTQGSKLLNPDGCLNFFAGPQNKDFSAEINFYDIHYNFTHYVGTSGGNTDDMREAIKLIENKKVNVAKVVTHVLGLDAVAETTLNQPEIAGGKKVVYTQRKFSLEALEKLMQDENSELGKILKKNNGIWSKEAEDYILENTEKI